MKEMSNLISIGRLNIKYTPHSEVGVGGEKELIFSVTLDQQYQQILPKLNNVFLIFTDHRVRYGKIDILKRIAENKAIIRIQDDDLHHEVSKERLVNLALDEMEMNSIDEDNIYYDPIGMKVIWNDEAVAVIKDFFFNGAHYVYEIEMKDSKLVMIPDVESFVKETNTEKNFIRVVDLDQFLEL